MSIIEQAPTEYLSTELHSGAHAEVEQAYSSSVEQMQSFAVNAATMAIRSQPEIMKKKELSPDQRVAIFAKWATELRHADGSDTPLSAIDERALEQDMLDLAA